MYYNPNTSQSLSYEELKVLLNISFPDGREQIQEWLLVRDNPPAEEGKIPVKSVIEMQGGIPVQTYILEDASSEEPKEEVEESALVELASKLDQVSVQSDDLASRLDQISSQFSLVEGAIMDLAAMVSNLHVFCSNAVNEMKAKG